MPRASGSLSDYADFIEANVIGYAANGKRVGIIRRSA